MVPVALALFSTTRKSGPVLGERRADGARHHVGGPAGRKGTTRVTGFEGLGRAPRWRRRQGRGVARRASSWRRGLERVRCNGSATVLTRQDPAFRGLPDQVLARSTMEKPMSTTRWERRALDAVEDEARGLAADSRAVDLCTVVSAGCRSAAKSRSPKPTSASRAGTCQAARPASVSTPSASRWNCRTTASTHWHRPSSSRAGLRGRSSSVVGAGTVHCGRPGRRRRVAEGGQPALRVRRRRSRRPARRPFVCAGSEPPRAPPPRGEAHQHVQRRRREVPRSRRSGCPKPAAPPAPPAECRMPVLTDAVGPAADDGFGAASSVVSA